MRLSTITLTAVLAVFPVATSLAAEPPQAIKQCVERAAVELTSKAGQMSESETNKLFRKYAAPADQLGTYLYGARTWPNFSAKQKEYGIALFYSAFHRRMMNEESPVDSRTARVVSQRLADHGAVKQHWYGAAQPVSVYQVIITISDTAGNQDVGVAYLSPACKFFDLGHGGVRLKMAVSARQVEEYKG